MSADIATLEAQIAAQKQAEAAATAPATPTPVVTAAPAPGYLESAMAEMVGIMKGLASKFSTAPVAPVVTPTAPAPVAPAAPVAAPVVVDQSAQIAALQAQLASLSAAKAAEVKPVVPPTQENQLLQTLQLLTLLQNPAQQQNQNQIRNYARIVADLSGGQVRDPFGNLIQIDPTVAGGLRQPSWVEANSDWLWISGALLGGAALGYGVAAVSGAFDAPACSKP